MINLETEFMVDILNKYEKDLKNNELSEVYLHTNEILSNVLFESLGIEFILEHCNLNNTHTGYECVINSIYKNSAEELWKYIESLNNSELTKLFIDKVNNEFYFDEHIVDGCYEFEFYKTKLEDFRCIVELVYPQEIYTDKLISILNTMQNEGKLSHSGIQPIKIKIKIEVLFPFIMESMSTGLNYFSFVNALDSLLLKSLERNNE